MYRKEPLKPWLGAVEAWGSAVGPLQNMELSSGTEEYIYLQKMFFIKSFSPRGLMDKASDSGSGDCVFDSRRGYFFETESVTRT